MTLVYAVAVALAVSAPQTATNGSSDCREWHQCRDLATSAYDRGDYERFHDLAWRAVQTGPPRDAALMYLLARAQSLSGRPHDALVMLGRLLDQGFVSDAATNDDFRAVRQLREWQEFADRMAAATTAQAVPAPPTSPAPSTVPSHPAEDGSETTRGAPRAASGASVERRPTVDDALRVSGAAVSAAGLAYDRVSSRFVVADRRERKLVIIDERSRHMMDLVTARSAGFFDITGFEIDPLRGDLWVVSAEPAEGDGNRAATALHKLQLVSGRPLIRVLVPDSLLPCRLTDVAVARDGSVFVLDALGSRVLRFEPASRTFVVVARLGSTGATSLAPVSSRVLYVAHATGIARIDVETGDVVPLPADDEASLAGLEHVRWTRDSLLGIQHLADGRRRAVRIRVARGRAVSTDVLDSDLQIDGGTAATVSGDDFYFVSQQRGTEGEEIVVRRSRIR